MLLSTNYICEADKWPNKSVLVSGEPGGFIHMWDIPAPEHTLQLKGLLGKKKMKSSELILLLRLS